MTQAISSQPPVFGHHPSLETTMHETAKAFHAHLVECEHCHTHPFLLCATGDELLGTAGAAAKAFLNQRFPVGGGA